MSDSRLWSESLSHVQLFATPWTIHSMEFSRPELLEWVSFPFSRESSHPGIEPRSPTLQADYLPAEPQGKPKNNGVGSLSLRQWIFPTQELNRGLLHCRQILYQLSYQGSPGIRAVLLSFYYTAIVLYFLFPDGHQNFLDHFFFLSLIFFPLCLIYHFSSEFTKLKCLHYHHILILSSFSVFSKGRYFFGWLRANKDNAFLSAKSVLGGGLSLEVISWL